MTQTIYQFYHNIPITLYKLYFNICGCFQSFTVSVVLIREESKTPLILISSHRKCADVVPGNSHSLINFGNSVNFIYFIFFTLSGSDLRGTIVFKLGSMYSTLLFIFFFSLNKKTEQINKQINK